MASGCSGFQEHLWKKDVCRNCFFKREQHTEAQIQEGIVPVVVKPKFVSLYDGAEPVKEPVKANVGHEKPIASAEVKSEVLERSDQVAEPKPDVEVKTSSVTSLLSSPGSAAEKMASRIGSIGPLTSGTVYAKPAKAARSDLTIEHNVAETDKVEDGGAPEGDSSDDSPDHPLALTKPRAPKRRLPSRVRTSDGPTPATSPQVKEEASSPKKTPGFMDEPTRKRVDLFASDTDDDSAVEEVGLSTTEKPKEAEKKPIVEPTIVKEKVNEVAEQKLEAVVDSDPPNRKLVELLERDVRLLKERNAKLETELEKYKAKVAALELELLSNLQRTPKPAAKPTVVSPERKEPVVSPVIVAKPAPVPPSPKKLEVKSAIHFEPTPSPDVIVESPAVVYSLEELRGTPPPGVDVLHKEKYLSTADFEKLFGMKAHEFEQLRKWKQDGLKKKLGLF